VKREVLILNIALGVHGVVETMVHNLRAQLRAPHVSFTVALAETRIAIWLMLAASTAIIDSLK
jgi:hypothetical protein